jgi:hypothetical protein
LQIFSALGGVDIFVDQAVEGRFSADLPYVGVGYGRGVNVAFGAGDTLGDALVRPPDSETQPARDMVGLRSVRRKPVVAGL